MKLELHLKGRIEATPSSDCALRLSGNSASYIPHREPTDLKAGLPVGLKTI